MQSTEMSKGIETGGRHAVVLGGGLSMPAVSYVISRKKGLTSLPPLYRGTAAPRVHLLVWQVGG